ncbi:O156 family O-antigen polymerase [Escherichia coli]
MENQHVYFYKKSNKANVSIVALIFTYISIIGWSPFFSGYLAVPLFLTYHIPFLLLLAYFMLTQKISSALISLSIIMIILISALTLLTESLINFNRYIFEPLTFLLCYYCTVSRKLAEKICTYASCVVIIGIVLSVISFCYAYAGGNEILTFHNVDGRLNSLYLTSFSNFKIGNIIRPSFIYDEPGAFSFVICFVVILREVLGRKYNWVYLLGGMITLSLTQFIILSLYIIVKNWKNIKQILVLCFALFGLIMFTYNNNEFDFFYNRFNTENGTFSGDNRSMQISNYLNVVNENMFLLGDYKCHDNINQRCESHGDISSSIVTPIYKGGILQLLLQIITHAIIFWLALRERKLIFPALVLTILLLQRPFFDVVGYSVMIYYSIFLMFYFKVFKDDYYHSRKK